MKKSFLVSALSLMLAVVFAVACSSPTATPAPTATTKPGVLPTPTVAATVSTSTPVPSATPAKVWKLKFDSYLAATSAPSVFSKYYWDKVAEKSQGRIKMEYYWSEALHRAGEQAKAVRDGTSETGYHAWAYTPAMFPLSTGLEQNYVSSNPDTMAKVAKEIYDTYYPLRYELEVKNNVRLMFVVPLEPNTLVTKKPINTIEDLKGLKIRSVGVTADTLRRLGATPVAVTAPEIYESMQRGAIDGIYGIGFSIGYDMKFTDVGRYWTDTGAGVYTFGQDLINMQVWQTLPDDLKTMMDQTVSEATDYYISYISDVGKKDVDLMVAKGIEFNKWSGDTLNTARNLVQPAQMNAWIESVKAQGFDGKEFSDKMLALVKKYEPQTKYQNPFDYWAQKYKK